MPADKFPWGHLKSPKQTESAGGVRIPDAKALPKGAEKKGK